MQSSDCGLALDNGMEEVEAHVMTYSRPRQPIFAFAEQNGFGSLYAYHLCEVLLAKNGTPD